MKNNLCPYQKPISLFITMLTSISSFLDQGAHIFLYLVTLNISRSSFWAAQDNSLQEATKQEDGNTFHYPLDPSQINFKLVIS